jgi:hypothetical protein
MIILPAAKRCVAHTSAVSVVILFIFCGGCARAIETLGPTVERDLVSAAEREHLGQQAVNEARDILQAAADTSQDEEVRDAAMDLACLAVKQGPGWVSEIKNSGKSYQVQNTATNIVDQMHQDQTTTAGLQAVDLACQVRESGI